MYKAIMYLYIDHYSPYVPTTKPSLSDSYNFTVNICLYIYIYRIHLQDHRQFKQRYYEFLDNFRIPDGPIFLTICGEGTCNGITNNYLSVSVFFFFYYYYYYFK